MLKTIRLFIKGHKTITIIIALTVTIIIASAVAIPFLSNEYKLEKAFEESLKLMSQNEAIIEDESVPNVVNKKQPLAFTIKKVESIQTYQDGTTSKGTAYKIIPSYNKDVSEWTKQEKEKYLKVAEEANRMAENEYKEVVSQEEQHMDNMMNELNKQSWDVVGLGLEANQALNQIRGNVKGYGDVSGLKVTDYVAIVYPVQKRYFEAELEKSKIITQKVIADAYQALNPKERKNWNSQGLMSAEESEARAGIDGIEMLKQEMIKRAGWIQKSK